MRKEIIYPLLIFLAINIFLYSWMTAYHARIPFNKTEYLYSNHYIQDPRISGKNFSLVNAVAQYDSQWYIKIADKGYPANPHLSFAPSTYEMEGLLYNFFPLFPICIALTNIFVHNIEISAFISSNLLLLASMYSLYFVVSQWFSKKVALKTMLLVLLFPFSIFLRGYYAEDLRLFLFIWFCYGLTQKNFLLSAISAGLLSITSGISLLLLPFYYCVLWYYRNKISVGKIFLCLTVALIPFAAWMVFCYFQTGDFLIFVKTRSAWWRPSIFPLFYNIALIYSFPKLHFRSLYGSQIDVLCMLLTLCITYLSKSVLPKVVWFATIVLAFSPLLVQDSISFARFTTVLFPFFAYIAVVLQRRYYVLLLCFFAVGLAISSLFFINWYWIE